MENLLDLVRAYSNRIVDGRDRNFILGCCVEELGEAATEIKIAEGRSYKQPGKDGIVGEYIDLIISAIDGIIKENPDITITELTSYMIGKCDKWEEKVNERLAKENDHDS